MEKEKKEKDYKDSFNINFNFGEESLSIKGEIREGESFKGDFSLSYETKQNPVERLLRIIRDPKDQAFIKLMVENLFNSLNPKKDKSSSKDYHHSYGAGSDKHINDLDENTIDTTNSPRYAHTRSKEKEAESNKDKE